MFKIYSCLTGEHDPWLVVLAGIICFLSALTAVNLVDRARDNQGRGSRVAWLATAAVATGFGIWSTHFIAMLAYRPGLPMGYDLWLTIASAVIAIAVTGIGITTFVVWNSTRSAALGGGIVGAGIASMHYTGMAAVRLPGYLEYDYAIVASSVVLGVGLGALALLATFRWRSVKGITIATGLLTLAICCMHFSAMGAVTVVPLSGVDLPEFFLSQKWLAIGIAAATATITILCLTTSLFDQHLVRRTVDESKRLETLANASTEGIVICTDTRIEYGNVAFLRMTGATPEELAGRPLSALIGESACQRAVSMLQQADNRPFETTDRTSCASRCPHRPRQPRAFPRPAATRSGPRRPGRGKPGGAVHRPRPLQGRQRHAGARSRRRAAAQRG
jgi:diguanylate cyclase